MSGIVSMLYVGLKEIAFKLKLIDEYQLYGSEIVEGGHCSFCGDWMPHEKFRVPKVNEMAQRWYTWGCCEDCKTKYLPKVA